MARAYLHDIPIDTFIKYYLDLENDPNAINENARYQPLYEPETTDTYYKCVFDGNNTKIDSNDINGVPIPHLKIESVDFPDVCTGTTKDIRKALPIIFNTDTKLKLLYPVLNDNVKRDILYYPQENPTEPGKRAVVKLRSHASMMDRLNFYFLKDESEVFKTVDNSKCVNKFKTGNNQIYEHPIYYIPIKDPITELFQYKSFYKYYAVIDNKYFYPVCFSSIIPGFNGLSHFYMDYTDDEVFNQNNYKLSDFTDELIIDGYAGEENTKRYYDKKNNIEYFLIIDGYNNERGKIYILPELNVLKIKDDDTVGFYNDEDTGKWIIDGVLTNYTAKLDFEPYVDPLTGYWVDSETNNNIIITAGGKSQFLKAKPIEYAYKDIYTGKEKYFSKETMPLSPIMKYHNYMHSIKKNDTLTFDYSLYEENNKIQYVEKTEGSGRSSFHLGFKYKDKITVKPFVPEKIQVSSVVSFPSKVESSLTKEKEILQIMKWNQSVKIQHNNIAKHSVYIDYSFNSFMRSALKKRHTVPAVKLKSSRSINQKNFLNINKIQNAMSLDMFKKFVGNVSNKLLMDDKEKQAYNVPNMNNYVSRPLSEYSAYQDIEKFIPGLTTSETENLVFFINTYINASEIHFLDSDLIINLNKYAIVYDYIKNIVQSEDYRSNRELNNTYTVKLSASQYAPIYDFILRIKKTQTPIKNKTYIFVSIEKSIYAIEKPNNKNDYKITILPILVYLQNVLEYYIDNASQIPDIFLKQNIHLENSDIITNRNKEIVNIQNIKNMISTYIQKHQSNDNNDELFDMNFVKLKNMFKEIYLYKNIYKNMDNEKTIIRKYEDSLFNLSKLAITTENIPQTPLLGLTKIEERGYLNGVSSNLLRLLENKEKSKNKGGFCFDSYEKTGYYGFINYRNTSSIYVDTINLNNQIIEIKNNSRVSNSELLPIEKQLIKKQVEEKNPIEKILNYRLFPTDNDETNYLIYQKKAENNFKLTTNVKFVSYLEKEKIKKETLNYNYKYKSYSDIFNKVYSLYTEYLYSNIKEDYDFNQFDHRIDNSTITFFKKSIPLYIDALHSITKNNLYLTDDFENHNYNIKYIFKHIDNDKDVFLSALEMKLTR